jgi:hypothetical protein
MNTRNYNEIKSNSVTRYEIALMEGEKTVKILGYTARKTKESLFNTVRNGDDLTQYFHESELDCQYSYDKSWGIVFCPRLRVAFTGRTERQVAANELL